MLTGRQLRIAAYVVGQELARRRRNAVPIPQAFRDLHAALLAEVSSGGQHECEPIRGPTRLETAEERAQRLGVCARTIRRRAAKEGVPMTGGRYLFEKGADT